MSATYYLIYDAKSALMCQLGTLKFLFSDSDDRYSHLTFSILQNQITTLLLANLIVFIVLSFGFTWKS